MLSIAVALILALLAGLSLGLLGAGGSILTLPILRYVLGMEAHRAVAVSLLVVGTTSVAALIPHLRGGRVRLGTGLLFGFAGMSGAFGAGHFGHYLPPALLLIGFAVMMAATALAMLRQRGAPARAADSGEQAEHVSIVRILGQGALVGAATGLVGAGGGFIVVPALMFFGKLPMQSAVATSLVVIAMQSFAGLAGVLGATTVAWPVALAMTAAAVLGSIAGSASMGRLHPAALRTAFGWLVVTMALFMLAQEVPPLLGYGAQIARSLLIAALGTLLFAGIRRARRRVAERSQERSPKGEASRRSPSAHELPEIARDASGARSPQRCRSSVLRALRNID